MPSHYHSFLQLVHVLHILQHCDTCALLVLWCTFDLHRVPSPAQDCGTTRKHSMLHELVSAAPSQKGILLPRHLTSFLPPERKGICRSMIIAVYMIFDGRASKAGQHTALSGSQVLAMY